jgi:LemA protein
MVIGLLIFAAIVIAVLWLVAAYNNLVAVAQRVDVLLRQRHDELPKLVETCMQYMKYEQQTFDKVLEARAAIFGARQSQDTQALGQAEAALRGGLGKLFALAEGYPELKADQSFVVLQQRISALETGISDRRGLYNDAVTENNVAIEQFPGSVVASMGGFRTFRPLEFDAAATADIGVKALLDS